MIRILKKQGKFFALLLLLIFLVDAVKAQVNLVPNPSFEDYTTCPQGYRYEHPDEWFQPDKGGGGYLNSCWINNGLPIVPYYLPGFIQYARQGVAYIGMNYWNGNANNYFEVKLKDSLMLSKDYYVEFYVISGRGPGKLVCNNVALLLTKQAIYADTANGIKIIPANPQVVGYGNPIIIDTTQWTKVATIYKAKGGEQYLTLGNFKYTNQTRYIISRPQASYFGASYFIDDVSVYDLDSFHVKADAGRDTTITIGDSVFIGSYTNGIDTIKWLQNGNTLVDTTRPGFWIWPTANTYYVLTQTVGGFTSSDTVFINVSTLPVKFISFSATLKENKVENSWQTANEINVNSYLIEKSSDGKAFYRIGKLAAENKARNSYAFTDENVSEGVSYYRVLGLDNDGRRTYSGVQRVENILANKDFLVYPNPANKMVYISTNQKSTITVVNTMGKSVVENKQSNEGVTQIDISNLSKGLYLIRVTDTKGKTEIQKLFIN